LSPEKKVVEKYSGTSTRLYSNDIKMEAMKMLQTMKIKDVSEKTGINVRTLKRWKQNGINRR
jgi:hypothetical protein